MFSVDTFQATRDPRYVEEAAKIMQAIEDRCKVECGYAALKNTATGELEDRLDRMLYFNYSCMQAVGFMRFKIYSMIYK